MIVVENSLISKLVRSVLRKGGYETIDADPLQAAQLLRLPGAKGEILLTNAPAPFLEFAHTVRLLYLTCHPDPHLESAFRECRVVRKPFVPDDLLAAIHELGGAENPSTAP